MAENLVNRLIGLIVTVAILGAIYLFLLKPILDTTTDAFEQFGGFSDVAEEIQSSFDDAGVESFEIESIGDSISNGGLQRLQACAERAGQDVERLQRCAERFQQ